MKNFKNMLAGFGLAAVAAVSTVSANPGLLLSDRNAVPQNTPCSSTVGTMSSSDGIIIVGVDGIIIVGRAITGLLISDVVAPTCSSQKDGLLLSD